MALHNFLLALGVGSALIAFWGVVRFPDRTPEDFGRALLHVCFALLLGAFTPNVIAVLSSYGYAPALASLLGVLMPVLVYTFLTGAWFLKLAHDAIHRHRL